MGNKEKPVYLVNKQTQDVYSYRGEDNHYTNIRTKASGEIKEEIAKKVLVINVPLTVMVNKYPLLEEAINKLNLKVIP